MSSSPTPGVPSSGAGGQETGIIVGPVDRIGVNSLVLFLSYGLNTLLSAVVAIFLVRYLGREEYGLLSATFAYISFFSILTSIGVDTIVTRDVAREPERAEELVGGAMGLRLLLSAISMVLCWLLLPVVDPSSRLFLLVVLASASFPFSFYSLYLVLYSVQLRMTRPKLVIGVWSILLAASKLGLIALGAPLEVFVGLEAVSGAVVFYLARRLARHSGLRPRIRFDAELAGSLLRQSWPVAVASTLIQVYLRIDQLMLYRLVGAEEVGLYAVGVRLVEFAGVIPVVFMSSVFPLLSRFSTEDEERFREATRLSFRAMTWVALPLAALLFAYAGPILDLLFGESFREGAPALRILSWSLLFAFLNSVLYNRLFAAGGQRVAAWLAGAAAVLNVGLNVALIPSLGGAGAAWATLVAYGAVPLVALAFPSVRPVAWSAISSVPRPAAVALAGLAIVLVADLEIFVGGLVLGAVYLTGLVAVRELGTRELRIVRTALGRRE